MEGSIRCSANYVPLSPISFLEKSALVYGDRVSIIYKNLQFTWKQTLDRCTRLASAISNSVSEGDVVATLAPNVPALYELHFGVPMAGAVLCVLNIRYDPEMLSNLLKHSAAKILFVDYQFLEIAKQALEILSETNSKLPTLVLIQDSDNEKTEGILEYEPLLESGSQDFKIIRPKDECDPISISYTSGTTANPKGVIYSHRGAYLNSLYAILINEMATMPVYLWTVPMYHCNGWCMAWGVAAQGGKNICSRGISTKDMFENIVKYDVTHMGGAPAILNMIVNEAPVVDRETPFSKEVIVMTGGAPPPPQVLLKMKELGFRVVHSYGMTETYGPGSVCAWKPEWDLLPPSEQAKIKSRQGVPHLGMEAIDVKDPMTMVSVVADGKTVGEIMFRGNTVMNGYLKNEKATAESFKGGWFRSGDLGVMHSDGYIELKDRSNDVIVCGSETVSTVEIEAVLFGHPAVLEAAVVGKPDADLGETICAFLKLKNGVGCLSEEDVIEYCRSKMEIYMVPKSIVFVEDLPKTSTGKTQKFVLREKAREMGGICKI